MYLYNVYYYAYIGVYVCVYWQHFLFGFADFSTSHLLLPVLVFDLCIFSKVPSSYSFSQHYCLSDLVPSYAPLFSRLLNTAYLSAWICAICAFWTFARKRLIRSAIWSFVHIHTHTHTHACQSGMRHVATISEKKRLLLPLLLVLLIFVYVNKRVNSHWK